eukprot:scaffold23354_cov58-Phaeocystis_antarctica.AAC.2
MIRTSGPHRNTSGPQQINSRETADKVHADMPTALSCTCADMPKAFVWWHLLWLELGQLRPLLAAAQLDDAPAHVVHVDDALEPARVAVGERAEPSEALALVLVHHRRVAQVFRNAEARLWQLDLVLRIRREQDDGIGGRRGVGIGGRRGGLAPNCDGDVDLAHAKLEAILMNKAHVRTTAAGIQPQGLLGIDQILHVLLDLEVGVLTELRIELEHELSSRRGQVHRETQHLRGVVRDAVDVAIDCQHAAAPLEAAVRQLVAHERRLLRARVEAQHLRGAVWDAHAAVPLVAARQLAAHERRLLRARVEAQHLRGVKGGAVDVAVGRQHAAVPLDVDARQLVAHERRLLRARVEAQHLRGEARDAVDVAVGRQHAAAPLDFARQLVAHERRLLRARVEAQHLRGVVRDAVDVAVGRQHAALPLVVAARQLVAHARRLLRARVEAQHLCGVVRDAVDVAVGCQHAAIPLVAARQQLAAHERRLLRARVEAQHLRGMVRDAIDVAVGRQHAAGPLAAAARQLGAHARRLQRVLCAALDSLAQLRLHDPVPQQRKASHLIVLAPAEVARIGQ